MADNRRAEAVDILARRRAADDIRYRHYPAGRDTSRTLPKQVRAEVNARVEQIEAQLRPPEAEYEAAYDVLAHGTVTADA